ncbi:MAG: PQQ-binding-like beta-propeller repeat protein, partial [Lentisphaerae bacterium]|nr:PQQ-binding-like beta-propeller repeat protein [Lentisphaerota bacterium]
MNVTRTLAPYFGLVVLSVSQSWADLPPVTDLVGASTGIVAVVDWPGNDARAVLDLLRGNELTVYFQSDDPVQVQEVRVLGATAGLLGHRLFVAQGQPAEIHLGTNLADCVLVAPTAAAKTTDDEVLRVLRPRGTAVLAGRRMVKRMPQGTDDWSHPYHGPDNNPQSRDQRARGPLKTQFIAAPKFSPMPQQTVAAAGRLFKAFGHIAHRTNQNHLLNSLLCINAYNGTVLWKRPLPEGFMIHRNTMVATADALYMGDHESCKVLDAQTGRLIEEIAVPEPLTDGPVWKWMAIRDGVLYGLVGDTEVTIDTQESVKRGLGHWPWGMWKGHDYKEPRRSFGFGRTLVAIDLVSKRLRWSRRTELYLDGRSVCMNARKIFVYSPEKALFAFDVGTGKTLWERNEEETIAALGPNLRAQHYVTGYATTCYTKCNDQYLFFAGPQRQAMSVVSADDGTLAWTHPDGNLQLVLREDAIYAAGPKTTGVRLNYKTGAKLGSLPTRRACTRATGGVDSVFYRASGGTSRILTATGEAHHIAAMRPPCQDGVLIANGHLYWGPWMCGCPLSLYANIALAPASDTPAPRASPPRRVLTNSLTTVEPLNPHPMDWMTFRGSNDRSDVARIALPFGFKESWRVPICADDLPTAPVVGGGLVFVADRTGCVQALDKRDGTVVWKQYASGPVYYPPAIALDRAFVGSADGYVYAFSARKGRLLWTYRVAPSDRRIPVFGKLISRWPVAGGVVVQNGTVFAAAGIANYDGTHVVALDAVNGTLKAHNTTSGKLAPKVNGGISLQGNMTIVGDELRFLGGGVYETARYALNDLTCKNTPSPRLTARFATAFYPYFPEYGKFVSLQHVSPHGVLSHAASYEGNSFGSLFLRLLPTDGSVPETGEAARKRLRRVKRPARLPMLWQDSRNRRFTSFIAGKNVLLAAGHTARRPQEPFLRTTRIRDGLDIWEHPLPADVVKGGLALDHAGHLVAALENGLLISLSPDGEVPAPPERVPSPPPLVTELRFMAEESMKTYGKGQRHGRFPVQESNDPLSPFSGKGIYFQQRKGQDTEVVYTIRSSEPVREIHFRGAASFRLQLEIADLSNTVILASTGPF